METLGWLGPAGGARQSAPSSSGVCWGWKRGHLLAQERISPAQMWGWIAPSELPRVRVARHSRAVGPAVEMSSRCHTQLGSHLLGAPCDLSPSPGASSGTQEPSGNEVQTGSPSGAVLRPLPTPSILRQLKEGSSCPEHGAIQCQRLQAMPRKRGTYSLHRAGSRGEAGPQQPCLNPPC